MKSFTVNEVLIYNPNLKSKKKKPIESDIQQAKIMAFFPSQSPIQQKCNTVGMAEGVYAFCDSLLSEELRQPTIQTIFMNNCCLVEKEVQQNIWIFLKIDFEKQRKYRQKNNEQEQVQVQTGYIDSSFTEDILQEFINHFYQSFKVFYGKIGGYLFLQNLLELQKIIDYFVPKYQEINSFPSKLNELNISSYLIKTIRAVPLDVNSTLKFQYFKNVLISYEPTIMDLMVFANGNLAFTSLDKKITEFFARYLFGCIEPYRFEQEKISHRFRMLFEQPAFNTLEKYGSIFNSMVFGYEQQPNRHSQQDVRASIISASKHSQQSLDLLGMQQKQRIDLIDVYLVRNGEQSKCKLNYFIEKNMVFLTFYRQISQMRQLIFANRFFHDNLHKFSAKISEILSNLSQQNDAYRFLFVNRSTYSSKCTFKDWSLIGNQIKYTLSRIKKSTQGQICTTYQNHWVYGIKRMNRILILLIPNEVPLHKLDEFASKMTKQYFYKCFM